MLLSVLYQTEGMIFVSRRTGKVRSISKNRIHQPVPLSVFSSCHIVCALDISPNDNYMIAIIDNQLFIESIKNQNKPLIKTFETSAWLLNVSWLSNRYLMVSQITNTLLG